MSRAEQIKQYLSVKDLAADSVRQTEQDTTSFVTSSFYSCPLCCVVVMMFDLHCFVSQFLLIHLKRLLIQRLR